jgi:hypothetical protein
MKIFNVQTGCERRVVRSMRRRDHGKEMVAVAPKLEVARPTACASQQGGGRDVA